MSFTSDASTSHTTDNKSILSVFAEESGIISIPLVTLSAMWNKASKLLSMENAIAAAPGNDSKSRMVISHSQDTPHHIRSHSMGNNCVIVAVLSGPRAKFAHTQ